jgi:hypothetical protein
MPAMGMGSGDSLEGGTSRNWNSQETSSELGVALPDGQALCALPSARDMGYVEKHTTRHRTSLPILSSMPRQSPGYILATRLEMYQVKIH